MVYNFALKKKGIIYWRKCLQYHHNISRKSVFRRTQTTSRDDCIARAVERLVMQMLQLFIINLLFLECHRMAAFAKSITDYFYWRSKC
jgi:hypothetical protein